MSKEFVFKTDVSIEELDRRAQEFESKRPHCGTNLWKCFSMTLLVEK